MPFFPVSKDVFEAVAQRASRSTLTGKTLPPGYQDKCLFNQRGELIGVCLAHGSYWVDTLIAVPQGGERTIAVRQEEIVECLCGCHSGQLIHIVACCQGMCVKCGRWFASGLSEHSISCGG